MVRAGMGDTHSNYVRIYPKNIYLGQAMPVLLLQGVSEPAIGVSPGYSSCFKTRVVELRV